MSLDPTRDPLPSLLHAQPLGLGAIAARAVVNGFCGGLLLSVGAAVLAVVVGLRNHEAVRWASVAALAGWLFVVGFILCFSLGVLLRSRPIQNGAFTVTGFAATFFGLGMLVVFFCGLLADVGRWFYYTPLLVERKNQETLREREALKKTEALRHAKRLELEKEMNEALAAAATEAEKKEIANLYLGDPAKLKELHERETAELAAASTDSERLRIRRRYDAAIRAVGGVMAENLRVFEAEIADRKKIADMPLRDPSRLAVLYHFLFGTPSSDPEAVGIKPALLGSLWLAIIMMLFAVPVGTAAALYLEEYKSSGRLAHLIQVNINNLAGVPSVVYGILGAFVFVELIFKPLHRVHEGISVRNVLGGGLTLGLLTLPVVIVSAQEAIRAVPQSIRHGAYALGATRWQTIWT
ncbi:MAG: ABC transporter permease subunit, partial [Gemmataceae bacterium]|nr:ABC transporter permease subunit [Gemmataceae bacterium]